MSNKSWPNLNSNLLCKMGQDFLDRLYRVQFSISTNQKHKHGLEIVGYCFVRFFFSRPFCCKIIKCFFYQQFRVYRTNISLRDILHSRFFNLECEHFIHESCFPHYKTKKGFISNTISKESRHRILGGKSSIAYQAHSRIRIPFMNMNLMDPKLKKII